ncbi:MAG: NfeD family protein [Betaproteobacteria bacterium]|nr:NfeD family protein [Betaproteobacteria bacterium]
MQEYLLWAIVGFALVIAELVTGTFYLLVLGVAALIAAVVAFLGAAFWLQAVVGAAVALIGVYLVHYWRQRNPVDAKGSNDLDRGQPVVFESWVDQASGIARVKYRGSTWDARIDSAATETETLYITGQQNGQLLVSANRPI